MQEMVIERGGEKPIFISAHMQQRLRERKGFNRRAIKRYATQVLELGETIQKNFERESIKIVNMFKNDCVIFYISKEAIRFATILTQKQVEEHTSYIKGVKKKRQRKHVLV